MPRRVKKQVRKPLLDKVTKKSKRVVEMIKKKLMKKGK